MYIDSCSFGAVLVQSWCSFGEVLVQFWCSSGAVLVQFWCSSGAVLVQFWCSSGAVLVQVWCRSGAVLVQFGAVLVQFWCSFRAVLIHLVHIVHKYLSIHKYLSTKTVSQQVTQLTTNLGNSWTKTQIIKHIHQARHPSSKASGAVLVQFWCNVGAVLVQCWCSFVSMIQHFVFFYTAMMVHICFCIQVLIYFINMCHLKFIMMSSHLQQNCNAPHVFLQLHICFSTSSTVCVSCLLCIINIFVKLKLGILTKHITYLGAKK